MPRQVSIANGIVNPYGEGDVRLDSTPYVNYYMRQEAEKKAKDAALDRYFLDMQRSITPAGMRTQEVNKLVELQKGDQEYYLKNRAAIKNPALDNGKSRNEYMARHADKLSLIQQSKNALGEEVEVGGILKDPAKKALVNEKTYKVLDEFRKPIYDPTRQVQGRLIENIDFDPKHLTPAQQQQLYKQYGAAAGEVPKTRVVVGADPNDPSKDIVEYRKSFTPKQLAAIGNYARSTFDTSPEVAVTFAEPNAANFAAATEAFKKAYGKDAEIVTKADAHAAETILHYMNESGEQKSEVNKERQTAAADAEWRKRQAIKDAFAKKKEERKAAAKTIGDDAWLESQVSDLEKSPAKHINITSPGGKVEKAVILGAPAPVLKEFVTNKLTPNALVKYSDGTFAPLFYKTDNNYNLIKAPNGGYIIDETVPAPKISRGQLKLSYGKAFATGKNLTGQVGDDGSTSDETDESTAPPPTKPFKGLPQTGKF